MASVKHNLFTAFNKRGGNRTLLTLPETAFHPDSKKLPFLSIASILLGLNFAGRNPFWAATIHSDLIKAYSTSPRTIQPKYSVPPLFGDERVRGLSQSKGCIHHHERVSVAFHWRRPERRRPILRTIKLGRGAILISASRRPTLEIHTYHN